MNRYSDIEPDSQIYLIEIQGTAETKPFTEAELSAMLVLARKGIGELIGMQRKAVYAA